MFGELESSSQHQVMGEAGEGGEGRGEGDDRFTATRSLLRGKVKTASLEVSIYLSSPQMRVNTFTQSGAPDG